MTLPRSIVVEDMLPHPPEKVWKALTESEFISAWLMPNDFRAEIGHRFTFKTKPVGGWDGVVHCQVLDIAPNRRLTYSWRGHSDEMPAPPGKLDTTVTWQLTPVDGGTRLRMEHAGFASPANDFAYDAMAPGWASVVSRIGKAIASYA